MNNEEQQKILNILNPDVELKNPENLKIQQEINELIIENIKLEGINNDNEEEWN